MLENSVLTEVRFVWALTDKFDLCGKIQKKTSANWTVGRKVNINTLNKNYGHIISHLDKTIAHQLTQSVQHEKDTFKLTSNILSLLKNAPNLFDDLGNSITLAPQPFLLTFEPVDEEVLISRYPHPESNIYLDDQKLLRRHSEYIYLFEEYTQDVIKFLNMIKKVPRISVDSTFALTQKLGDNINWYNYLDNSNNIELIEWEPNAHLWLRLTPHFFEISITHQTVDGQFKLPSAQGEKWFSLGKNRWAQRDIEQELSQVESILKTIDVKLANPEQIYQISLADAEKVITELETLPNITIQWHKHSPKIFSADIKSLSIQIETKGNALQFRGGIEIDGEKVIELQQLLQARKTGYVDLKEGNTRLQLTKALQNQLTILSSVLDETLLVDQKRAFNLMQLDEHIKKFNNSKWQSLQSAFEKNIEIDENALVKLRKYQKEGVKWAIHLMHHGFGACLADDMGLGKTLQALKVISHFSAKGPCLVVCPKSVLFNWQQEAKQFTPELNAIIFETHHDKIGLLRQPNKGDLVIMGYSQLHLYKDELKAITWQTIVIDEAQQIKNPNSQRTQVLTSLEANCKMALSGTPIENNIAELWSLFSFLNPELLGSLTSFKEKYAKINKDENLVAELRILVSPFILRRLKKGVLDELPEKIEINHDIELTEEERAAYEAIRLDILSKKQHTPIDILAGITRLRQVCCDASLVFESFTEPSSKIVEAIKIISEALAGGHRVLIFSQFVGLLKNLGAALNADKILYSYLDGQSSLKQREEQITQFKTAQTDIFLISLKAGGTGLNLTEADTVIHLDPWWNPAVEDQASDRAYRLGQTQTVTIYRLIAKDTIEEHILELHQAKRHLALQIIADQSDATSLDPEFLLSLLSQSNFSHS